MISNVSNYITSIYYMIHMQYNNLIAVAISFFQSNGKGKPSSTSSTGRTYCQHVPRIWSVNVGLCWMSLATRGGVMGQKSRHQWTYKIIKIGLMSLPFVSIQHCQISLFLGLDLFTNAKCELNILNGWAFASAGDTKHELWDCWQCPTIRPSYPSHAPQPPHRARSLRHWSGGFR